MRVLIVITTGMDQFGGLTNAILNYIRAMNRDELKISFASFTTDSTPQESLLSELNDMGCSFIALPDRNMNPLKYMLVVYKVSKEFDCIHINANSATAILELFPAYMAGIKNRIVQNHTAECNHYYIHKLLYPAFKKLYTRALAVSKKAGEWIFGNGKYIVLKNGIDVERYVFSEEMRRVIRERFNIPGDARVVGHLGKIYEPKNHKFIIEVFSVLEKKVNNTFLLLVGDGHLKPDMEHLVEKKGLKDKVIFAGMQEDVKVFLDAMDVFLFPSLWEGLPISLMEAEASGLPCVISDKIDEDVCTNNLVYRISLDSPVEVWTQRIELFFDNDRKNSNIYASKCLKEKGFDTRESADFLREIYLEVDK